MYRFVNRWKRDRESKRMHEWLLMKQRRKKGLMAAVVKRPPRRFNDVEGLPPLRSRVFPPSLKVQKAAETPLRRDQTVARPSR